MSPSRRVRRGILRLGIAFAGLAALSVLGIGLFVGSEEVLRPLRQYDGMKCLYEKSTSVGLYQDTYDKNRVDVSRSGCYGVYGPTFAEVDAFRVQDRPAMAGPIITAISITAAVAAAAAIVVIGIFWTIGWIVAGFLRD